MSARPWLVALIILNLGVAAWALLHRVVPPGVDMPRDAVPVLERVTGSAPVASTSTQVASVPAAAPPAMAARPASTPHACGALGPFGDAASAQAARVALQARGLEAHARSVSTSPKGFNVFMAPQSDGAAATALAERLKAAGFNDLFVMRSGDLANGIALGKFGSEASALRQQAALQAAGFTAQVAPAGAVTSAFWLDVDAVDAAALQSARRTAGAAQLKPASCGG